MSELEALQKEIERLDQRIAEVMKTGSNKEKDELVDGLMKRIQALEDKIASSEKPEPKKERGRPKKEKAETKTEPEPKEAKQIDYTEEDEPWWTRV